MTHWLLALLGVRVDEMTRHQAAEWLRAEGHAEAATWLTERAVEVKFAH